ncbi:MAG: 23S rRNA (pseudouridine(1915)-N(3))-methyltransferase RlmH [Lentisphaeria bacterium]|nr:23S rRNA (pseudouridine(1915)-N(3))-methyltransferase RlmH [Lentisphaeria bacterium]
MRFHILTIGKIKDRHLDIKLEEYLKRIRFEAKIEITALKDSDKFGEGDRIVQALERFGDARVFALTEEGRQYTSPEFAREIAHVHTDSVFVIGGPDGLSEAVKRRADQLLSLSTMTFPHEMALVLLTEQIFRALTIIGGRKYHK